MHVKYKDKNINYNIYGSGEKVIVLIHGFPVNGNIFDKQQQYLSNIYTVIVPDLPGAGASPYNASLTTIEDFAAAVNAVLEQENKTQCSMIGHSMGGYITLAFAEKYPQKLKGFGLLHSHALADDEEKKENRLKAIKSIQAHGSVPFINKMVPGLFTGTNQARLKNEIEQLQNDLAATEDQALIRFSEIMMHRPDRQQVLKEATVPVLFVLGEEDKTARLEDVLPQTYLAGESVVKILSGVAHMSMLEDAGALNETIDEFVANA